MCKPSPAIAAIKHIPLIYLPSKIKNALLSRMQHLITILRVVFCQVTNRFWAQTHDTKTVVDSHPTKVEVKNNWTWLKILENVSSLIKQTSSVLNDW